jgi:hypothetical protein
MDNSGSSRGPLSCGSEEIRARPGQPPSGPGCISGASSELGLAYTRCCLGYADHQLGQTSTAARHFGDALILAHKAGRSEWPPPWKGACATVQDADICGRLLGAAQRIRGTSGIHLTMIEGHDPHQAQAHARSVLGTRQFLAATNTAKHSSLDEMRLLGASARAFKTGLRLPSKGAPPQEGRTEPAGR